MNQFPVNLTPHYFDESYINESLKDYYIKTLRNDIYLYLLTSDLSRDFFSLDDFFNNNNIKKEITQEITTTIISELKSRKWFVKLLFNNTAIIICKTQEDIDNSMWKSSFNDDSFLNVV